MCGEKIHTDDPTDDTEKFVHVDPWGSPYQASFGGKYYAVILINGKKFAKAG